MQPRETVPSHLGVEWNLSAPQTLQEPTSGTTRSSLSAPHTLPVRDAKAARARGHSPSKLRLLRLLTTAQKMRLVLYLIRLLLVFLIIREAFSPNNPLSEGIYRSYNPFPDGIYNIRLTTVEVVLIRGI